ncbi:cyclic lactone autoinducer peptide [Bacillus sp. JZ8]
MKERIEKMVMKIFGLSLVKLGTIGTTQMCAALFHEVEVPEELKENIKF